MSLFILLLGKICTGNSMSWRCEIKNKNSINKASCALLTASSFFFAESGDFLVPHQLSNCIFSENQTGKVPIFIINSVQNARLIALCIGTSGYRAPLGLVILFWIYTEITEMKFLTNGVLRIGNTQNGSI